MVRILCGGLTAIGVNVVDVQHPADIKPGSLDVLQMHWAEQVFWRSSNAGERVREALRTVISIWRHRRAGTRIAWIVHNLEPHKMDRLSERLLWPVLRRAFCALSDVLITLSPATASVVETAYGLKPGSVRSIRHPRYPDGPDYQTARTALGLDHSARLVTFFGTIRPNKGVESLIGSFRRTTNPALRLHVLGAADEADHIRALAAGDPRITLKLGHVSRPEIERSAAAADLVAIPLQSQLHSGSLIDALSLGAPVITTPLPFSTDLLADLGQEWVRLSEPFGGGDIADRPVGRPDLSLYDPKVVAGHLMRHYLGHADEGCGLGPNLRARASGAHRLMSVLSGAGRRSATLD